MLFRSNRNPEHSAVDDKSVLPGGKEHPTDGGTGLVGEETTDFRPDFIAEKDDTNSIDGIEDFDFPPDSSPPADYYDDDSVLPGEKEHSSAGEAGLTGEKSISDVDKLSSSAQGGNSFAQYKLAQLYYSGHDGVQMNKKLALELFEKAAENNNPYAAYRAAKYPGWNWYRYKRFSFTNVFLSGIQTV